MILLKDAFHFAMIQENVRACVLRICFIAKDNVANKAVTLPIIGALLTLRDKNLQACMYALALLDPKTLEVIQRLGHFYAPDLEENIIEYVLKRKSSKENEEELLLMEESPRTMLENKK